MPLSTTVNLPTVIIALVVAVIFIAIIVRGVMKRKRGESGCGCGCSGCPNSAACRGGAEKSDK